MGKAPCCVEPRLVRTATMGNEQGALRSRETAVAAVGGTPQHWQHFVGGQGGSGKIVIGSKGGKSNIMVVFFFTVVVVSSVYGKQGEKLFIS